MTLSGSVPALPGFANLALESLTIADTLILIHATVADSYGVCPDCGEESFRVHSTYARRLRDLPWQNIPVQLVVAVRRFFCQRATCPRKTFAEQLPGFMQRSAQRTVALNATLQTLGLTLGGKLGAVVGRKLGISGSAATVLRRAHAFVPPPIPEPRAVGIDEWAIRKGHTYGSLLVDLERHRPIDLLPEHAAEPIAAWFQAHQAVAIIARDRGAVYRDALRTGAPNAQQVADRWHLTQNLGTALHDLLVRHTTVLREVAHQLTAQRQPHPVEELPAQRGESPPPGHIVGSPELRQYQFAEAKRLRTASWSYARIGRELQLNRRTVRKYIHAAEIPRRVLPQATSSLTPYLDIIREHWRAGERSGVRLLAAVRTVGFGGSLSSMYRLLKTLGLHQDRRHVSGAAVERVLVRSPRQAMWLLVRDEEQLAADEVAYREALISHNATVATSAKLAQRFLKLIRERDLTALEAWLADAEQSGIKELRNFAQSLRRDLPAVSAALSTEWNNGQTEGHVNRLKMIKRTMYGRANFELLRKRVLYAA